MVTLLYKINCCLFISVLQVIQAIDLVVALMDCGEISQVEVAPRFAYGSMGNGKDIPAESTILYTIELVEVSKEKDLEEIKIDERLRIGYIVNLIVVVVVLS